MAGVAGSQPADVASMAPDQDVVPVVNLKAMPQDQGTAPTPSGELPPQPQVEPSDEQMQAALKQHLQSQEPSDEEMQKALKDHLSGNKQDEPEWKGYARGLLDVLPAAGAMGGAALAGIAGGVPTMGLGAPGSALVGAGIGGATGKAIGNAGKVLLGDTPQDALATTQSLGSGAMEGVGQELGGKVIGKAAEIAGSLPVTSKIADMASNIASKLGEAFTGVPKETIKNYANNVAHIKALSDAADGDIAQAADSIRDQFTSDLDKTRKGLNDNISTALKNNDSKVDGNQIISALKQSKNGIDKDLYPDQVSKIDDLITTVQKKLDTSGDMTLSDAHNVKKFLQDKATQAYRNPGDIFSVGTEGAKAAKSGAATARQLVNQAAPEVTEANNNLANLHDIEDNLNAGLITSGKTHAALISAGNGTNPMAARMLERLGNATGTDMLGQAKNLAAMKTFTNPALLPQGINSTGRTALASGLGYVAGGPAGGVMAAALTSPAALKQAINAGIIAKNAFGGLILTEAGQKALAAGAIQLPKALQKQLQPGGQ